MSQEIEEQLNEEESPDQSNVEFPPETVRYLTWSSLRFIRAPSSDFLMWSIIAIAMTCVAILLLSSLIEMDVTIRAPGQIVSDFGSRDALSNSAGEITEIRKKSGDAVQENDVIALIKIDAATEEKVISAIESLQVLEKRIRFYQNSKKFDFSLEELPSTSKLEAGPALDAMITLEQQVKYVTDLRARSKKGLDNELRPLRQRAALLEKKIRQIKKSNQAQLLGQILEATQEEAGRIRSQISTTENESNLKIEQGVGELLKSTQAAAAALDNYLVQRQVRSPIKGLVSDVYVKINASIEANKLVAKVQPEDSQLMAGMHVYSKDIVKVTAGQNIYYKIEAYPYQTYGSFTGKVISFEQAKESDAALGEYLVYGSVDFPSNLSPELKSKMKLIVGMKLGSDIVTERKSGSAIIKKMVFERH